VQNGFSTQQKIHRIQTLFHPTHVAAHRTAKWLESKTRHLSLLVQAVDKTAVVKLFDQAHIDEVFGPGGASFRVPLAELGERFFDRL
jgi:hypothetical protein